MSLAKLIERDFGVKTDNRVNPLASQVATTVTQLLRPNPNRLAWSLVNLGANPIYIAIDPLPSSTHGIYVARNGGNVVFLWNEDFELVTYPLWGIADTAAADVYLIEIFEV
jgi:hypothetical protein